MKDYQEFQWKNRTKPWIQVKFPGTSRYFRSQYIRHAIKNNSDAQKFNITTKLASITVNNLSRRIHEIFPQRIIFNFSIPCSTKNKVTLGQRYLKRKYWQKIIDCPRFSLSPKTKWTTIYHSLTALQNHTSKLPPLNIYIISQKFRLSIILIKLLPRTLVNSS